MLKAIVRTGILLGASYAAYYAARKYWGTDFDRAVDSARSMVKDIGSDFTRKDKAVTEKFGEVSRRAI
jgi:hypothetical protein